MSKEELYKLIAEETGFSVEKIKYVDDHIFYELQKHMNNPEKPEFMINKFGVFSPRFNKIKKYIEAVYRNGGPKSSQMFKRIELYKEILDMGKELDKIRKENGKKRNGFKK